MVLADKRVQWIGEQGAVIEPRDPGRCHVLASDEDGQLGLLRQEHLEARAFGFVDPHQQVRPTLTWAGHQLWHGGGHRRLNPACT